MFEDEEDLFADTGPPKPLWRRIGVPVGIAVLVISTGVTAVELMRGSTPVARPHQDEHVTRVMLPPPPPPPPPPKPPPPTPQKMVQDKPKEQATPQKAASIPKAAKVPSPPAAVTTSITGPGPGSLAAGNGGGGDCIGSGCGSGDGTGGDNDAYYSSLVKSQIEAALRHDDKLRFARFTLRVTFMLDGAGHVTRAAIGEFSGDEDVKAEIDRVLLSVSTNDTPPADMTAKVFTVSITGRARG